MIKRLATLGAVLAVMACAGPNSQTDAVHAHMAACDAYAATLHSLAAWRSAGELSDQSVETVEAFRPRMNAICDGTVASTPAIVTEFNTMLATLIIMQSRGD